MKNGFTVRSTSSTTIELGSSRWSTKRCKHVEVTYDDRKFSFLVDEEDFEPYSIDYDPSDYVRRLIDTYSGKYLTSPEVKTFLLWLDLGDYFDEDENYVPPNSEAFDHDCLAKIIPRESARVHRELHQLQRMRTHYIYTTPEII